MQTLVSKWYPGLLPAPASETGCYGCRFMQCLKRWIVTEERVHLYNMAKYGSGLVVVRCGSASSVFRRRGAAKGETVFRYY